MHTDPPTDDDLRWLGFTETEVRILHLYPVDIRRTVYELRLEELMAC